MLEFYLETGHDCFPHPFPINGEAQLVQRWETSSTAQESGFAHQGKGGFLNSMPTHLPVLWLWGPFP
jgi:hypothetical protein